MSDIDWPTLRHLRRRITRLEAALVPLYNERAEMMTLMSAAGMGQREIGTYWRLSQPRVSQIFKKRAAE